MKIYEFSVWGAYKSENGLFSVEEIEVEEKPKSYIGKHRKIPKDKIGVLSREYGKRMYLLSADPKPYIDAVIASKKRRIEDLKSQINGEQVELGKWECLQRKVEAK